MDDGTFQQDDTPDELSEEDRAVLQAFESMDLSSLPFPGPPPLDSQAGVPRIPDTPDVANELLSHDEMLAIFTGEVNEDLLAMRGALQHLEQLLPADLRNTDQHQSLHYSDLRVLKLTAHKIKGTSGAMDCSALATIAFYVETLSVQLTAGIIAPFIGLQALSQSLHALQATLNSVTASGKESRVPLTELEDALQILDIHLTTQQPAPLSSDASPSTTAVRVDGRRLQELVQHSEQLAASSTALEHAQAAVEEAIQELQAAHDRLRRLEASFAEHFLSSMFHEVQQHGYSERPASSLVARIMDETLERTGRLHAHKHLQAIHPVTEQDIFPWDELEIDRFKGDALLSHSLSEAIADVATATSQLRVAFAQLTLILHQRTTQLAKVRDDTLLLRLTPAGVLISRVEQALVMNASLRRQPIHFESQGASTEIDQDILEELKRPLSQLVRTSIPASVHENGTKERAWMYIQSIANEVSIEIGFSMPIASNTLDELQAVMQRLHGSISTQRNASGGTSFHLRLPRSHGAMRALLLRVGNHTMAAPLSQIEHISLQSPHDSFSHKEAKHDRVPQVYVLSDLLGLSPTLTVKAAASKTPAYLLLAQGEQQERSQHPPQMLEIDEILGNAELIVQPLAAHLRRPGIVGTATDGIGNVLLVLDLLELIKRHEMLRYSTSTSSPRINERTSRYAAHDKLTVLIADDSVSMRQSLRQTLLRGGYHVLEAHDGVEALDMLLQQRPDFLILDLEMPNLNGYEVLNLIQREPALASLQIIMMTARTSDKHYQRARELGAHAYLTKPSSPEILLETLEDLLLACKTHTTP